MEPSRQQIWQAYHQGRPIRVPVRWNVNNRMVMLDPALNERGWSYAEFFHKPAVAMEVMARFEEYRLTGLGPVSDGETEVPDLWTLRLGFMNHGDAAYFGARVEYPEGQLPSAEPAYGLGDVDAFLGREFTEPLDRPFFRDTLSYYARVAQEARSFRYAGRPVRLAKLGLGTEGPLTVAVQVFGSEILTLLVEEPPKARRLLEHIQRGILARNRFVAALTGETAPPGTIGYADDSVQLIGLDTYREVVLPVHRAWYEAMGPASARRAIHLCGDATRLFRTIRDELGVTSFDTGFPVDFAVLRAELGPEVEISGGPHVSLLLHGRPEQCAQRTREILASGVLAGGRFILQEGNNLAPRTPLANLQAVYDTARSAPPAWPPTDGTS